MENNKGDYYLEVFAGDDEQWYYRLRHVNGRKLATSEAYAKKGNAVRAVQQIAQATGLGYKVQD